MPPGSQSPVLAVGEGIETVLSPFGSPSRHGDGGSAFGPSSRSLPAACAHVSAFYIAADADAAGRHGVEGLGRAATALGVLPLVLTPELGDFNEDLRRLGSSRLVANLARQLVPDDATAYLSR